jgi:hypothetical protein
MNQIKMIGNFVMYLVNYVHTLWVYKISPKKVYRYLILPLIFLWHLAV